MKPIIGIVEWPYLDIDGDSIYEVITPIVEWIIRSGGRPIGLFSANIDDFVNKRINELNQLTELELKELKETIMMCDGIIKPGATKFYPYENKIYEYAYDENIPYFGICAGMQIMRNHNSEYVPNIKNDTNITHYKKEGYAHYINIKPNTKLHSIIGKDRIEVNSRHKYHLANSGLKEVAALADDDIIEALEVKEKLFNIGVQWHPELLPMSDLNSQNLFGEFIEAAKTYKKKIK